MRETLRSPRLQREMAPDNLRKVHPEARGCADYPDRVVTVPARGLEQALSGHELRMHYQPEFDLVHGQITAVEALLRWQHPRLGLLSAERFVPDTEQTEAFTEVQLWVIDETCRQLARWRADGVATTLTMRLNIAGALLVEHRTSAALLAAMERHAVPPEQLCLELTERRMPSDLSALAVALDALRKLGVSIAIDDFGVGQATLTHLVALPVDVVKIDQSFVSQMMSNEQAAAVVASVVALAGALRLRVVAEGIDSSEPIAELVRLGCTRGQGNALAEPMPPAQVEALLRR